MWTTNKLVNSECKLGMTKIPALADICR